MSENEMPDRVFIYPPLLSDAGDWATHNDGGGTPYVVESTLLTEREAHKMEVDGLKALLEEVLTAESCPYCPNRGWYAGMDKRGEPEQVQCEWCGNTENGLYQTRNRIAKILATPDPPQEVKR